MAIKIPLFCTSITVVGSATLRATLNGNAYTLGAIPEGVYWQDPTLDNITVAAAVNSIDAQLRYLFSQSPSVEGSTGDSQVLVQYGGNGPVRYSTYEGSYTATFDFTHAGSTTAAKTALARMGAYTLGSAEAWLVDGFAGIERLPSTNWSPLRGESFKLDMPKDGYGNTVRSHAGSAYAFNLGSPQARRTVSLFGVPGAYVNRRLSQYDQSFERCIWTPASQGEKIRFYQNINAARSYLTVALTATATSCTMASTTGFAQGETAWIDGEPVYVATVTSGTVLQVVRTDPVAHAIYSPCSDDFVGTFVLANSGGNINMGGFEPTLLGHDQDYWDMEIALEASV